MAHRPHPLYQRFDGGGLRACEITFMQMQIAQLYPSIQLLQ
jgi:hypothetical protein